MENLTICKASAGSGKTYKLTGEYLKLAFDPHISFKSILAVTFTNKATSEMKQRILSAIHKISKGEETGYETELYEKFGYSASELKDEAKKLLNLMLNQYSYFKISTIDSFFQQVIKSIAYELRLDSGFTLELDTQSVLEAAVSRLIDDFGTNSDVSKWIMQLVDEKFDKGTRWKFSDDIVKFANEAYEHINTTADRDNDSKKITECSKMLTKITNDFISELNALGAKGVDMIRRSGLKPTDFKGGAKSFVLKFNAYANASMQNISQLTQTMINASTDVEQWYTKTTPLKESIIACVNGGLMLVLSDICTLLSGNRYRQFCSATVVLKLINKYAIAYTVDKLQNEICEEQNLFLLRSSMPLLKDMIDESDTPFIYEKFGYSLRHFMIDEFQDTSTLNWNNFLPLIKNSTDEGHKSLIVGDVKQAIYRWRGGDWNLLDNKIEKQFAGTTKVETLEHNWRSCENIIKFNNWCFSSTFDMLNQEIEKQIDGGNYEKSFGEIFKRTYGQVTQKVPEKNIGTGGYVSVESIQAENSAEYKELACQWVITQLDELAELGYAPGDIAILVRGNKLGSLVATRLAEAQNASPEKAGRYRFVSNESVRLGNNQAVRLIVAAVQFLVSPDDIFAQGQLIWLYFSITQGVEAASEAIQQLPRENGAEVVWSMMPEEFSKLRTNYMQLDIVQLCSRLNRILLGQNNPADIPFLNEFEDRVQSFNERNGSNLQLFIDWWNDMGCTQAIAMNEHQNAIQIISIHKSKGLEFKAVIIPFYSWTGHDDIIWGQTNEEPFSNYSDLPFPIQYTNAAAETCFSKEFYNEQFMRHIDNLNILYVALTRASRDMRICTMVPIRNKNFDDCILYNMITNYANSPAAAEAGIVCNDDCSQITMGKPQPYVSKMGSEPVCDLSQPAKALSETKISIVCHSDDYFSSVDFDREKKINLGQLYHHIFEYIITADDVENAVSTVANEGFITSDEVPEYISKVNGFIARQPDWFSPKWQTLTEQSIMLANGEIKRPDRILESDNEVIVVDYKFTSFHNPEYNHQVSVYADALRQLTNKKVRGYLWYVWPNEKVEVITD